MYLLKRIVMLALMALLLPTVLWAQYEEETANGVVSLAGREGFSIETKKGDFVFKPYLLVQASGNYNWYDDEGLDPAYNQDNVANSGFAIPYAVLGFTQGHIQSESECRRQRGRPVAASVVRRGLQAAVGLARG